MAARYGLATYDSDLDGLIVGTGNTPTTLTDYTLETPIVSGDGAGQLVYGLTQIFATQGVQGEDQFKPDANGDMALLISRVFHNKSGSAITINEIGFLVLYVSSVAGDQALLARKVLDTPVTIPNNSYKTMLFTFKFPSD